MWQRLDWSRDHRGHGRVTQRNAPDRRACAKDSPADRFAFVVVVDVVDDTAAPGACSPSAEFCEAFGNVASLLLLLLLLLMWLLLLLLLLLLSARPVISTKREYIEAHINCIVLLLLKNR